MEVTRMPRSALEIPQIDPSPIVETFRGSYATDLLTAAVARLNLFAHLATAPLTLDELSHKLGLAPRPANVLVTALRAMGLIACDSAGRLSMTPLAREHLTPGGPFEMSDYISLAANSPGVLAMVERLRTNRPATAEKTDPGAAFIYRDGLESAMDSQASARRLTLALAGRARNVAPALAKNFDLAGAKLLLDVGGGTGIYSIALLQRHPTLRATVFDRPEVLKVAAEFATEYGVADRLDLVPGDMFKDPLPKNADVTLLSNILHDWDIPECERLLHRCAESLRDNGRLVIHDVFLDDDLGGPLPIALYSAALFTLTEGRAYSAAEYRAMLTHAGLKPEPAITPTLIHCGLLTARKET
jgi:predicted O-methyltransferase YrrM